MLQFLRRSATSVLAWVVLGMLALVFGLSFGLPSDSLTLGPKPIVSVHGQSVLDSDYQFQTTLLSQFLPLPKDPKMAEMLGVKQEILETVLEREVLAHEAEALGLRMTQWDAETLVLAGHIVVLGDTADWLGPRKFNYDLFKGMLRNFQVAEKQFFSIQRKELLARTVRDLMTAATAVSEGELRAEYDKTANKISLRHVRFDAASHADLVDPSAAEIEAWAQAHDADLRKQLASQGSRFTKLGKQVHLRVIEIRKPTDPADAAGFAAARKRATEAKKRLDQGEDFRAVARALSDDPATARRGGDFGWANLEGTGSGLDPAIDRAATDLALGTTSAVVETATGFAMVRVDGRREGDVPEDEALRELAEEAVKRDRGLVLARRAAEEALAKSRGGKPLSELFSAPAPELPEAPEDAAPPLPVPGARPELQTTGVFGRHEAVPGLGEQRALVDEAWKHAPDEGLIDRVFEIDGAALLVGVVAKEEATDEGFARERQALFERLSERKSGRLIATWAERRCLEAKGTGRLTTNDERIDRLIAYEHGPDDPPSKMPPYSPCERVGNRGGALQFGMFARGGGGAE